MYLVQEIQGQKDTLRRNSYGESGISYYTGGDKVYRRFYSVGYFNLGLVYDKLQQDDEALENYWASMEIDNELGAYEDVLLTAQYVAEIYERNGMPEEAAAYRSLYEECEN